MQSTFGKPLLRKAFSKTGGYIERNIERNIDRHIDPPLFRDYVPPLEGNIMPVLGQGRAPIMYPL